MKKYIFIFSFLTVAQLVFSQSNTIFKYYMTKGNFRIDNVPISFDKSIEVGQGVYLEDPNDPFPATPLGIVNSKFAPSIKRLSDMRNFSVNESLNYDSTRKEELYTFYENESDEEMAYGLYASFGLKLGFGKLDLAYKHIRDNKSSSKIIIFNGSCHIARNDNSIVDKINPKNLQLLHDYEKITDDDNRFDKFTHTFGTHYINGVLWGYNISIYGKYQSTDAREVEKFSGAFRSFAARAELTIEQMSFLRQREVTLKCYIRAGGSTPSAILTNFDDIQQYFNKLKTKEVVLSATPIGMTLLSNRYLLNDSIYPKLNHVLKEVRGEQFSAPFGVPKGYPSTVPRVVI